MEQRSHMNPERPYPTPAILGSSWLAVSAFCSVRKLASGTLVMQIVKVSQEESSTEFDIGVISD